MSALLHPDLLRDKTIFVSGGGSGINLAIAKACASVGANIAICGRTESRLESAAEELRALGARVVPAVADVRDWDAVQAAFARTAEELGPVSGVVAGAAGNFVAPAEQISTNGFKVVQDIDVLGSFHVAKAAFEQLRETQGSVLFITAGQSVRSMAYQVHVAAAKAGVDALMRGLALEWGPLGIRSNSIAPGPVAGTEGMKRLTEATGDQLWNDMVPLGRFAEAEEVATMATVLLSPLSSYVNGARLTCDGGLEVGGSTEYDRATREAFAAATQQ
ncbi:SDR family oxidoreductase [Kribbia dieselivorans]|uniref:SDR family oxidoreductase n=1 Tax=Kribbia dieselivorans TaxID=331526 RepID=UPI0008387DA3|nr:SDR family oxidoreductase [Kribbia dieselivorans]